MSKFCLTILGIYAIFLLDFRLPRGVSLIRESKTQKLVTPAVEPGIALLRGGDDPFSCVSAELQLVEDNLIRAIRSRERDLTNISAHLVHSGGKRIRPMVTLLAYFAFGGKRIQDIIDIATAIELIHTATLLHDDIIDGAETRRGKESAYKKFGLKSTLVAGDFLFIKAFEFAGKFDETVVQWTADACTLLTEGEILQGLFNRNRAVTLDDYLEIVKRKTASLFHTGAKIGAYLAGANPALVEETERYGLHMGIAFQMVDDILDIVGHPDLLGKPTGMDLRDGNPALPIILAVIGGDLLVSEAFDCTKPSEHQIAAALAAIKHGASIREARSLSKRYAEAALASVKKLPPSKYRNGLKSLVQLIVDRDF
ncbi:MAG TPA: polyprenyl synthetase family protein [Candidatus Binatia bacterium]